MDYTFHSEVGVSGRYHKLLVLEGRYDHSPLFFGFDMPYSF